MSSSPSITIRQVQGYQFLIDFGETISDLLVDEAEPIGRGEGPFPEQILVAGVTNCLCASLVFALAKYKQDAKGLTARSSCQVERNAEGRLRITGIDVVISFGAEAGEVQRIDKVLDQFERFCTVSESVKAGIPVTVAVHDADGRRLK
ncbi:OsmC family protein [Methylobacterium nigriterrae]|uniref:OsmC family protein n=1 Tax=Methylobacterium nigriterrae TaxID=3127512 RepID=UPI003013277B